MNLESLFKALPQSLSPADRALLERAHNLAVKAHRGQKRASGEPYVNHCLAVATILAELGAPIPVVAAGLLHDTVEDTSVTLKDLADEFGPEVARLVDGVTKLTQLPRVTRRERKDERTSRVELAKETLRKTFLAMGDDVRVVMIKLADRLHNMRTLSHLPSEKHTRIAQETLEIFAPLANRLGIWQMKGELEDLSFRYVYPDRYKAIAQSVAERRVDREKALQAICERLHQELTEASIRAEVTGRPKHLYSIYRKMERKGVPFEMVYDVRGVRVLVESEPDCYLALGVIHNHWNPIPGTFDDYVATPKDNFYQSLHTAVVYDDGKTLEVQIRTPEMQENAEYGIAAHWRYKEGRKRDDAYQQRILWLRRLMDWRQDADGDTDFIEYSERLYLEFTRQLRAGSGPVPIGKALMEAKRTYLAETPQLRGIHEKALLEATLFGFPMFAVDMPGQRYTPGGGNTIVTDVSGYASDPGDSLGLEYSDVTINPSLTRFDVPLKNVENNATVMATYLKGKNGVLTNPVEPVLPAEVYNVSVASTVLRGVGFRGGDYTDLDNILPLIGAATTEVRGVHSPFVTEFFFPVRLWSVNYIDALANGPTRLVVTPAHFKLNEASADRGTLRRFDSLKFRLFYSDYVESNPDGTNPALSAAPSIVRVSGTPAGDAVDFQMRVVGNPAAGIQEVWVTYTAIQGSFYNQWQSLDLAQNPLDSTLWEGKLTLPEDVLPGDVRYVVQSANGVGLVAFDTNQGAFHTPRFEDSPTQQTALNLISPANTGRYGTPVEFTAQLTGSQPLPPQFLTFSLGPQSRRVLTGPDGLATTSLSLLGIPGSYQVKVTFPGTAELIASKAESPFTIDKQSTTVQLKPQSATVPQHQDTGIVAIACEIGPCIDDQGEDTNNRRLGLKTVFFVVEGSNGAASKAVITDYAGRARLGSLALPAGAYTVTAYFGGENIPLKTNGTVTNVTQIDERYIPSSASGTLTLTPANNDPVCTNANALTDPPMYLDDLAIAWPPNSQLVPVSVVGVTDPDGDPVTITFTGIFQDERVGRGPASPDGFILGTNSAQVRAERDQNDNGRIYHLHFTASDGSGGACSAQVLVGVPPDQGGMVTPIDDGELYDSTIAK